MIIINIFSILAFGYLFYNIGRITNKISIYTIEWTDTIVLGIVSYSIITGLFQIFYPINFWLPTTIIALTTAILTNLSPSGQNKINSKILKSIIGLTIIFIPLLYYGNFGTKTYDHFLYHDQTIAWFNNYKLILGLANLHGRFGFNNSLFPMIASFQINHQTNLYNFNLLLFILFIYKSHSFYIKRKSPQTFLGILFLAISIYTYGFSYFNNVSPDFQLAIFTCFVFFYFMEYNQKNIPFSYLLIIITFTVTIKLATALFLFILFCSIIAFESIATTRAQVLKSLIFPSVILSVWFTRSLILSGQIIYPFKYFYLSFFKHSVSVEQVNFETVCVTGWAQHPGIDFFKSYALNKGTLNWVPYWLSHVFNYPYAKIPLIGNINISIFAILSFSSGILLFAYYLKNKNYKLSVFYFALVSNVIYWFLTAPDVRFGIISFVILIVSPLFFNYGNKISLITTMIFVVVCLPYQVLISMRFYLKSVKSMMGLTQIQNISSPNLVKLKLHNLNKTETFEYFTPSSGDQSPEDVFPVLAYPSSERDIYFIKNKSKPTGFYRYPKSLVEPYKHNIKSITEEQNKDLIRLKEN